jgi:ribosome-binding protein aMBF1 (putative translation factor)
MSDFAFATKKRSMVGREKDYPALIKSVREQLDLSQEDLV